MKAILEFDLDSSGDHLDYRLASQALPIGLALWKITQNLRRRVELRLKIQKAESSTEVLDVVFSELNEIVDDCEIDIVQLFNSANRGRRQPDDGLIFKNIEDVERAVCKLFNTNGDDLRKRKRSPGYVVPRQTAMALSVLHFPEMTYADIGWHFGRYDPSTVSHALKSIRDKIDTEKDFRELTEIYFRGMKWPI